MKQELRNEVCKIVSLVALMLLVTVSYGTLAQNKSSRTTFDKIKLLVQNGNSFDQKPAIVTFDEESILIKSTRNTFEKTFRYSDIKRAEYSYSKSPRWKTGLSMGAASILFPPLLLVALPIGFTKHRRHWVTIKTKHDFAVLKISKKNRKTFIPTLEIRAGITVNAVGEDK